MTTWEERHPPTVWAENVRPTGLQVVEWIRAHDPAAHDMAELVEQVDGMLDGSERGSLCFMLDHVGQVEHLRRAIMHHLRRAERYRLAWLSARRGREELHAARRICGCDGD